MSRSHLAVQLDLLIEYYPQVRVPLLLPIRTDSSTRAPSLSHPLVQGEGTFTL